MSSELKDKFILALEEHYGAWERNTSRFGNASFGRIAKEMCMSPSQFSKLIYGTATEGMYRRATRNIDRLVSEQKAKEENQARKEEIEAANRKLKATRSRQLKISGIVLFLLLLVLTPLLWFLISDSEKKTSISEAKIHPLTPFFDRDFNANFNSPYLLSSQVQDFCPCSAFEGEWSLDKPYKLPLPANRNPGIYYLARDADVRMKCFRSDTANLGKGRVLIAFEYLINEIWVDTKQTPLSPRYFNMKTKEFTEEFGQLEFESQAHFERVATIHSFFIDRFLIYPDSIIRKGEPVGRYATDVNSILISEFEINLNYVLDYVVGDLNQTDCESTANNYCNPNDLSPGESTLSFDCLYTISNENLGIGGGYPYTKSYRLEKQNYSDNLTCDCPTDY